MRRLLPFWLAIICLPFFQKVTAQTCATNDPSSPVNITPTTARFPGGDPVCKSNGSFSYRFDSPIAPDGTPANTEVQYTYTDGIGNIILKVFVKNTDCGEVLRWEAAENILVDTVYAKGGTDQNVYRYNLTSPRAFADGNIHCPTVSSGKYADFSHVDFCFRYKLTVSKTAVTGFKRTYKWKIDKSVNKDSWDFFKGDDGTSTYTVKVEGDGYTDSDWGVSGDITVVNNTPSDAVITGIDDLLDGGVSGAVNCSVTFPYTLSSGATLTCSYSAVLPSGTNGTNTATVTTSSVNVLGSSGVAKYEFGNPTTEVNKTVNITDDKYSPETPWTASWADGATFTYTKKFDCSNAGVFKNIATITETGQWDDAVVKVTCYELEVSKTAATSLTRTWKWTIDKSADQTQLTLATGQSFTVNYTVKLTASPEDSKWAVTGKITVKNPAPINAVITSLKDLVSDDIAASITCSESFPVTIEAGKEWSCTYSANLPDAAARVNTATATLQNYSTDEKGVATESGTSDFTGTANVAFGSGTSVTEVDKCVTLTDDKVLGTSTYCASNLSDRTYSLQVGPYAVCGDYTFKNTATIKGQTSGTEYSDYWDVVVNIPCGGCTLTQGYWKTHSKSGPAPYDDAWKNVGVLEENTIFFLSGQSWIQVFRTPPAGNAYYNLAHQYMAAKLNILNGAGTTPAVTSAITAAEAFFAVKSPASTLTNAQRNSVRTLASTLDQYNNGLIGPGHCDEDNGSSGVGSSAAPFAPMVDDAPTAPQVIVQPGLKAWPNPSTSTFTLVYGSENRSAPVQLKVYDMNGRLVYSATGSANRNFSFGQNLPKGLYMAEVTQENNRQTTRLIKQ